jgi:hypothetical protein
MPHAQGISPFVCACFTLNYLIGTGFLTLPWAFEVSGILLSCATMVFTCVIANIASDYILTAMARADAATVLQGNGGTNGQNHDLFEDVMTPFNSKSDSKKPSYSSIKNHPENNFDDAARGLAVEFDVTTPGNIDDDIYYYEFVKKHGKLLVGDRKYELTELVRNASILHWVGSR